MADIKTKKIANYNISIDVLDEFNKLADERAINRSKLIELLMKKFTQHSKGKK